MRLTFASSLTAIFAATAFFASAPASRANVPESLVNKYVHEILHDKNGGGGGSYIYHILATALDDNFPGALENASDANKFLDEVFAALEKDIEKLPGGVSKSKLKRKLKQLEKRVVHLDYQHNQNSGNVTKPESSS